MMPASTERGAFTMTQHRKFLIGGVALLLLAGVLFGTLRLVYGGRAAYVNVRWAPSVDEAARERLERELGLKAVEFRQQRTWLYFLADVSTSNIQQIVKDPAVEDTHHIDRKTFQIDANADRAGYGQDSSGWIADMMEFGVRASVFGGIAALGYGAYEAWRRRRTGTTTTAVA